MPCPISPDFDFLDATLNLERLPVEELAELRKSEPVHWVDVPGGTGGFGDKGYWLVTKHADVKEVSKRNDIFGSSPDGAIPDLAASDDPRRDRSAEGRPAEHGRAAAHPPAQDHLPRLHPALRRSAGGRTADPRREHREGRGRRGHWRLRRTGVVRAAAAGDRRPAGRAAGGPRQALPLVQRDDGGRRPGVRRRRPGDLVVRADHLRHEDGRGAGQEPDRRHRDAADRGRRRGREALRRRVRLLRGDARGRGQRDHPQLDHPRHDRVLATPRAVGTVQEGTSRDRRRRDRPLGHARVGVPAHRARGRRTRWRARSRRASAW